MVVYFQVLVLTADEEQLMRTAVITETAVSMNATRLFEDIYDLKTGKPVEAARGLIDRMQITVNASEYHHLVGLGADGIEEEVKQFASKSVEGVEVNELLHYIRYERTSEKMYPNGIRDKGRTGMRFIDFLMHKKAQEARLTEAEVLALRLYTTAAYKHMNNPLRDDARYRAGVMCPLPVTTYHAVEGIKKLRALNAGSNQKAVLWRGMRSVRVTEEFMKEGGTELAFMSTTSDINVAVRYSLSQHSLLLKIVASNFMSTGAELQWLSAFPSEAEILYPPLTYLQPTGRKDTLVMERDRKSLSFTVVEVEPFLA